MKRFFVFMMATIACVSPGIAQEEPRVPEGWTKINICDINFYAPSDLNNSRLKGIDSCVAQFSNNDIILHLDYGIYNGFVRPRGSELDWKRKPIFVEGKNALLTTFANASRNNSSLKYGATLYLIVKSVETGRDRQTRPTTLAMSVISDKRKDRDAALAIFRTIRFQ